MKAVFLLAAVIVVLSGAAFFVVKQRTYDNLNSRPTPARYTGFVSFTGEIVCLPHRNPGEVQTLECAFGLKDEFGTYFSLEDTDPQYGNVSSAPMGQTVKVEGELIPGESDKYASIGTIKVTRIVTVNAGDEINSKYVELIDWPPSPRVENQAFSCTAAGDPDSRAGGSEVHDINGSKYCVTTKTEVAAGSAYMQYVYARDLDGKTLIFTFTARMPQCANFEGKENISCLQEQSKFDPDTLMGKYFNEGKWKLAVDIQQCMPLSNMGAKAKCDALIKQINDFDTCVAAGFVVRESSPRQCATPDGRSFMEK